jgi:hypothetical protein
MSDEKSKVTDKAGEIAKNIWLAGVGAYGRAVDEAQGRLEKAGLETPKLFRDLVEAGAALEEEAREATGDLRTARTSVEERISKVRENFHMQRPARIEDIADLHKKIDLVSSKLDLLADALTEAGIITVPARRATATRRKATSKKTPAKKAPGRKAPGRKAPAKKAPAKRAGGKAKNKTPVGTKSVERSKRRI